MRARVLQRKGDQGWFDDCYAYENNAGELRFRTNLTWERAGLYWSQKLVESGVSLDNIETVLMPGDPNYWRWLPVEECADPEAETFLQTLNKRCHIPEPKSIKDKLRALATKSAS